MPTPSVYINNQLIFPSFNKPSRYLLLLCYSAEVGTAVGYSWLHKRAETMVKTGDTWQLALILVPEIPRKQ